MSFFGNNSRPDLKASVESVDRGDSISNTRYLGEANNLGSDLSAPSFAGNDRLQSNSAPTPPEQCTNVVAAGARWKGSLKVDDSVRVDGNYSGDIETKSTVQISEGAQVDAKIQAAFVVISGNFKGEIRCEQKTELMPRGVVTGEIITKVLGIHEGATFDGNIQMTAEASSRQAGARGRGGAAADSDAAEKRNGRTESPVTSE